MRARMVGRAEEYPWSSAPAHCGIHQDEVLAPNFPPTGVIDDCADWLHEGRDADEACDRIRRQTHTGRFCGSPRFFDQLEHLLQRTVHPKKTG